MSKDILCSPGPGAYNASDYLTRDKSPSVAISQTKRNNFIMNEEASKLGPGNYEVTLKKEGPSYTIGGKGKNGSKNNIPGPGNYQPNHTVIKDSVRSFKMGSSKKERGAFSSKSYSCLPGPGNYNV